jgi:hypothetical protein
LYEYIFVEASPGGFFSEATHQQTIAEYAQKGWRLIQVLATDYNMEGKPRQYEIIFERPQSEKYVDTEST